MAFSAVPFFGRLRVRLTLLVLCAVVPALALMLYTGFEQRRNAADEAHAAALRFTRLSASQHDDLVAETRRLLFGFAQLPGLRSGDAATCNSFVAELLENQVVYANFGAARLNGDIYCSSVPLTAPINIADRAYFTRAVETRAFAVGDYLIGRVTGRPTLNLGYPLLDNSGQLTGIVFAGLDLAWFNDVAVQASLPSNSTLTLVDKQGTVLARYPEPEK